MEFRKQATSKYAHFVFYPSRKNEALAVAQIQFVQQELSSRLRERQIWHMYGGHVYNCLEQCKANCENTFYANCLEPSEACVASECEEQESRKTFGKCLLLNIAGPAGSVERADATRNHLHILIYAEMKSGGGPNWSLEAAMIYIKNFFYNEMCSRDQVEEADDGFCLCNFDVCQKQIWCPYSIYAEFAANTKSHVVKFGEIFSEFENVYQQSVENKTQNDFPKRPPVLRSKTIWSLKSYNH